MAEKILLVATAVVYKNEGKKRLWFITKTDKDEEWELPKTVARKGESSVRAAIRMMAEQGGMRAKVLEEVGRSGGATKVNGNPVSQRLLYYLMHFRDGEEALGFAESDWLEYDKAMRRLSSKRDRQMLREAKKIAQKLDRDKANKKTVTNKEED